MMMIMMMILLGVDGCGGPLMRDDNGVLDNNAAQEDMGKE